jgi:hypothetical protein
MTILMPSLFETVVTVGWFVPTAQRARFGGGF